MGALATALILSALIGAHFGLMIGAAIWVQLMGATTLLVVGHLLTTSIS